MSILRVSAFCRLQKYVCMRKCLSGFFQFDILLMIRYNSLDPDKTSRNSTSHPDPNCLFFMFNSTMGAKQCVLYLIRLMVFITVELGSSSLVWYM